MRERGNRRKKERGRKGEWGVRRGGDQEEKKKKKKKRKRDRSGTRVQFWVIGRR